MKRLATLAVLFVAAGLGHAAAADKPVDYVCQDGTVFTIIFKGMDGSGDAVVKINGDTIPLANQRPASGMWYASPRHEFRGKGDDATWTIGRRAPTDCHAVPAKAEAKSPAGAWLLTEIGGKPSVATVKTRITIVKDGAVSGTGGCNRISTMAKIDGSTITFEPASATMMACPEPAMAQEQAFLKALGATKAWRREGGTLILLDAAGKSLASFAPVAK
ncbi:META domain-containing protein [Kaistia dalseonensis]|uniref:Heat shock protein HslJ n=1 Tax=Kaistia dalseonensis TaxID=410840 RepID=A0ABU0H5F9_9HYPH|nr:META domain-containing protein [Kaistia dalseonensis]MCX5494963.1 META domain-containing protein [Kaistia dalseonensis]MDQ0437544.1 heat shock protein HslJ [Kaistia dalseonensis]